MADEARYEYQIQVSVVRHGFPVVLVVRGVLVFVVHVKMGIQLVNDFFVVASVDEFLFFDVLGEVDDEKVALSFGLADIDGIRVENVFGRLDELGHFVGEMTVVIQKSVLCLDYDVKSLLLVGNEFLHGVECFVLRPFEKEVTDHCDNQVQDDEDGDDDDYNYPGLHIYLMNLLNFYDIIRIRILTRKNKVTYGRMKTMDNALKKGNTAILLMAGKGQRLYEVIKEEKQFLKFNGKELFLYPLKALIDSETFDRIIVVTSKQDLERTADLIASNFEGTQQDIMLITGGSDRNESVKCALFYLANIVDEGYVLIHDAARPFLNQNHIRKIMAEKEGCDAITYVTPCSDSLFRKNGEDIEYLDRKNLYLVQTPQLFSFRPLLNVYLNGYKYTETDDFSKCVRSGMKTKTIEGDSLLFKVTGQEELSLLEYLESNIRQQ